MAATVTGWMEYAEARGDVVAQGNAASEALVRAQDYIRDTYVRRFRRGFGADSEYVDQAIYEAAKLELAEPGFWSKTFTPDQQKVLTGVGDIRWQARNVDTSGPLAGVAATPVSTKIEAMLRPYMAIPFGVYAV